MYFEKIKTFFFPFLVLEPEVADIIRCYKADGTDNGGQTVGTAVGKETSYSEPKIIMSCPYCLQKFTRIITKRVTKSVPKCILKAQIMSTL